MRHSRQDCPRPFNRIRLPLSILLALLFVSNAAGQIRSAEVYRFVRPSATSIGRDFFSFHVRFAGGVAPWGTATFHGPANAPLTPIQLKQLRLVILDKDKLRNHEPDFDAIGIRWENNVYR